MQLTLYLFSSTANRATNAVVWKIKTNSNARVAYMANVFTAGMSDNVPLNKKKLVNKPYKKILNKKNSLFI